MLESALATPRATFAGELLHPTLSEQAGAYLFHLARNHPFVDGNKRIALMTMLVFVHLNEHWLEADPDELTEFVVSVAAGFTSKTDAAQWLGARLRSMA